MNGVAQVRSTGDASAADTPAATVDFVSRAAGFQGVTPGETSVEEMTQLLGAPLTQEVRENTTTYEYVIGPFPKVELAARDGVVSSIVIYVAEPLPRDEVAEELGLADFEPVPVRGEAGESLGEVYPERGVLFSYAADSSDQVGQLVLEPISAEPFWLRIAEHGTRAYESNFASLQQIIALEPGSAEARARLAVLLLETGRYEAALKAAREAHRLAPGDSRYTLMLAKVLAENGDQPQALILTRKVLDARPTTILRAGAESQLGDLLTTGRRGDYKQAVEHHLAAVKLAAPLANDEDPKVRREAKLLLIDAHLSVANNIARGPWKQKDEVVPQWLRGAEELAASALNEGADSMLTLLVCRRSLEAYAAAGGHENMAPVYSQAVGEAEALRLSTDDPFFDKLLQWELAQAAFCMLRLQHEQGQFRQALQTGEQAIAWIEAQPSERHAAPAARHLIGQLYFHVGAIHAVQHQDHDQAVRWYERALPFLSQDVPAAAELGRHGERFVSMGVSYWETGVENEGLDLTRRGLDLMQDALRVDALEEYALAVPYSNLAAMYRKLGREAEAREYAARAARLEQPADRTR